MFSGVDRANYRVFGLVPVSDQDGEVSSWLRERNRDQWPAKDPDAAEAAGCLVERQGWKVEEAANLIFHLENVSEVLPRRDRASGSIHSILVRVLPHLDPVPVITSEMPGFNQLFILHHFTKSVENA